MPSWSPERTRLEMAAAFGDGVEPIEYIRRVKRGERRGDGDA